MNLQERKNRGMKKKKEKKNSKKKKKSKNKIIQRKSFKINSDSFATQKI